MKQVLFVVGLLLLLTLPNLSNAQSASGKIIYYSPISYETKQLNSVKYVNQSINARLEIDDPNSIFNGVVGVCENWTVLKDKKPTFSHGLCLMTDKDGDTFVTFSSMNPQQDNSATVSVKGGTGKFIKLKGSGTGSKLQRYQTDHPADVSMNTWTLKYTL